MQANKNRKIQSKQLLYYIIYYINVKFGQNSHIHSKNNLFQN